MEAGLEVVSMETGLGWFGTFWTRKEHGIHG